MNEDNLNEILLNAEVEKIKSETKLNNNKIFMERIKLFSLIVGSILVFCIIKQPGYILSKKDTEESIARERTKLMLNWVKEDDLSKKEQAFKIIKYSYIDKNWLDSYNEIIKKEKKQKAIKSNYHEIALSYEFIFLHNKELNIDEEMLEYIDLKFDEPSIRKRISNQIIKLKSFGQDEEVINYKIANILQNLSSKQLEATLKKLSNKKTN